MKKLLEVKNLSISFEIEKGRITAVEDSSFTINEGEVVGLVGESGCGKSVTAMSILRLLPTPPGRYEQGEIIFEGQDLVTLPIKEMNKIRGKKIGMIFQEPMTALSPLKKIGKQMVEAFRTHSTISKTEALSQAQEWLTKVGIPDAKEKLQNYPYELSGGMRQRVMIAMAQMLLPDLIIADEPTTALDVTIQAQVFELMKDVRGENAAMLLITHDMGVIWENCDRVIVMYASQIVETGTKRQIFKNPQHPYTQGLLKAVPQLKEKQTRMPTIEGNVPPPTNYPQGCHFSNRCEHATQQCLSQKPLLKQLEDQRQVRCFLLEETPNEKAQG